MIKRLVRFLSLSVSMSAVLILSGCGSEAPKEPASPTPAAAPAQNAAPTVTLRVDPNPPLGAKENMVHVTVQDASGKPVNDAQVHMTLTMPAMPEKKMPEMKSDADLKWTGSDYSGPVQITMAGGWDVVVEAKRGNDVLATYKTHLDAK